MPKIIAFLIACFMLFPVHARDIEDSLLPPLITDEDENNNPDEQELEDIPEFSVDNEVVSPTKPTPAITDLASEDESSDISIENVKLRGLNKVTARQSILNQRIGDKVNFGNLEILPMKCWVAPPEDSPESKVLLDIWEQKPSEEKKRIFYGWMFASSPGLVSLEHPVYDINVLGCY
ncbi:MAG: DUF2155 domain-containing protein [Rickettsiales bacterium]|nr:DUF2155 domain-containing protein [Rickettsiales bacterium]